MQLVDLLLFILVALVLARCIFLARRSCLRGPRRTTSSPHSEETAPATTSRETAFPAQGQPHAARAGRARRNKRTKPEHKAKTYPVGSAITGRFSLLKTLDLSHLEHAPRLGRLPGWKDVPEEKSAELMTQAQKAADRLYERRLILEGLARPAQNARELAKLVHDDPTLSAEVINAASAPCSRLHQPVESVHRAVLLLGHVAVRSIAWRTCIAESANPDDSIADDLIDGLWRHSFAASRVTFALAKSLGLPRPDDVSIAALLHDIGKILYLQTWPAPAQALYRPVRFSDHEVLTEEENRLVVGHARLGGELARRWGLPSEICQTIDRHHAPSYLKPGHVVGNRPAIAVVHIADLLCHIANEYMAGSEIPPIYLPDDGWLSILGVRDSLEAVCSESVILALADPAIALEETSPWAKGA